MMLPDAAPIRTLYRATTRPDGVSEALWNSRMLRACRGESVDATPVWLMRQAGRYMTHYRERRSGRSFLSLCRDSALAAEVTLYAREWLNVDAAIIFSDILIVLEALGMELTFLPGDGPALPKPIREAADVARLGSGPQAAADLAYVYEALRLTVKDLPAHIPCIGFAGAPFTLASYAIEGGGSRTFTRTKSFMYCETLAWHALLAKIVDALIPYLQAQVAAGASILQLFDSWGGELSRADYMEYVQPHLVRLVRSLPSTVPVIVFGTRTTHLLDLFAATGADVVGLDQHVSIDAGWKLAGGAKNISVQGNLDPALLLGSRTRLLQQADDALASAAGRPGFIFNLGHGIIKETDPEQAKALVAHIHQVTSSGVA